MHDDQQFIHVEGSPEVLDDIRMPNHGHDLDLPEKRIEVSVAGGNAEALHSELALAHSTRRMLDHGEAALADDLLHREHFPKRLGQQRYLREAKLVRGQNLDTYVPLLTAAVA